MRILRQLDAGQRWLLALTGLTLSLAIGNLGKAIVACQYAVRLPDLPTSAPLSYFAATAGFWCIAYTACALGLSNFRAWARWATLATVTLHQSNVWVNRILLDRSAYARLTTPRDLVLTMVVLAVYWLVLNLRVVAKALKNDAETD